MKENCGIIGIYAPELQISQTISLALISLQHRGQESCGIVTCEHIYQNNKKNQNNSLENKKNIKKKRTIFHQYKGIGLVSQVFNCEDILQPLVGNSGIGHVRYSTAGKKSHQLDNTQPVIVQTYHGQIAIGHNGNLTTHKSLRKKMLKNGVGMFRDSDIEVIAQILASNPSSNYNPDIDGPKWEERIISFMNQAEGAYSIVILTSDGIFGFRDHLGMRPLCIGEIKLLHYKTKKEISRYIIASETCALVMVGAKYIREIKPGEIIKIDKNGFYSIMGRIPKPALCVFEYIYFSRPDSFLEDQLIIKVRERLGIQLAKEAPAIADIVVGVPESSVPAAIGYSKQSGIPYNEGIIKNRYVHRTFIQPTQTLRELGVSMKFTPIFEHLKGKKIVLIDDSIVRGNTTKNLIKILRNAGVIEIHMRVSSPPIRFPCFMGIDMATTDQMIAFNRKEEEICKLINADSLKYLSPEGLIQVIKEGIKKENHTGYCNACFTGQYPLEIDDW